MMRYVLRRMRRNRPEDNSVMNDYNTNLGDMMVVGNPPAKLWKALAVVADGLHPGFDLRSTIIPGKSKNSCVLCALTVRDFLLRIGFTDAAVRPVAVVMWASECGKQLHSLGIGSPEDPRDDAGPGHWIGHMVTTVAGFLIDTTLYCALRPQWPQLTGMVVLPIHAEPDERKIFGLDLIVGVTMDEPERGYQFNIGWLDNPYNRAWRGGPDARDRNRREPVVAWLIKRFGRWEDAA